MREHRRDHQVFLHWLAGSLLLWWLVPSAVAAPTLAGCPIFPPNNAWNQPIDRLPVHARSAQWVASGGTNAPFHPDFGTLYEGAPIGIPYVVVPGDQPKVPIDFRYVDESDPGPYPIPPDAPIEGGADSGGDRHILVLDRDRCLLYETWRTYPQGSGWTAGGGAIFDLRSNALRPDGWTSADAAGLPILPGLVRYDEVQRGRIDHALRLTLPNTHDGYLWPARHRAGISDPDNLLPPMGARFRLKAAVDISRFSAANQVILRALKKYGAFLADNGGAWFVSGVHDMRWNDDELSELKSLRGGDFEVVDTSSMMADPDSGATLHPVSGKGMAGLWLLLD